MFVGVCLPACLFIHLFIYYLEVALYIIHKQAFLKSKQIHFTSTGFHFKTQGYLFGNMEKREKGEIEQKHINPKCPRRCVMAAES